jgi:tyrosine-protein kinase Etk/Wzc
MEMELKPPVQEQSEQADLVGFAIILVTRKRLILIVSAAAFILSAAFSIVLPNQYRADVTILPPQQNNSGMAAAMLSQLGGGAGLAAGVASLRTPNEMYVGLFRSRAVVDKVIQKFGLQKREDDASMEAARKSLEANTTIAIGKDGLIDLEVVDREQKLVAPIANTFVAELQNLVRQLAVTEASQRRVFFERELVAAKNSLVAAELTLKRALATSGVASPDAETASLLENTARLKSQAAAKEVQLRSMRAFVTPNNPEYRKLEEEVSSLHTEIEKLQGGNDSDGHKVQEPGNDRATGNVQLYRDLKYRQMLYELLAKQYEAARLDEAKNPALIQVVDQATEPERKFKPRRSLFVLVCTSISAFIAILLAVTLEMGRHQLRVLRTSDRWKLLKSATNKR